MQCILVRTWLVLVFALDLENVKKVGRGCVDLNQVLVILGSRIGKIGHLELVWSLDEQDKR